MPPESPSPAQSPPAPPASSTSSAPPTEPARDPDCLFCRVVAGELPADVVACDPPGQAGAGRLFAFRDINPQAPAHVLIVPVAHYPDIAAAVAADPGLVAELIAAGVRVAEREGVAGTGYRLLLNTGAHAGQTVFHAHLHVLGGEPLGALVGGLAGGPPPAQP